MSLKKIKILCDYRYSEKRIFFNLHNKNILEDNFTKKI